MAKDAEELKIILDMAANGGKMQAMNEMLLEKIAALEAENKELKAENQMLHHENADLNERLSMKTNECKELEEKMMYTTAYEQQDASQQGPVLINSFYYVLSWPKTVAYVGALDSDGRKSAGHFIHQTLPDDVPRGFIRRVDELTKLECRQDKRLADALEEVAKKPTTQNIYGDKNDFNEDAKMLKLTLPANADPAEIAMRIAEQQAQIEKKGDTTRK